MTHDEIDPAAIQPVPWSRKYPDPDRLRSEVIGMAEVFKEILLEDLDSEKVESIYFKGSGNKPWDSVIDYVPLLSDVDVHVVFKTDEAAHVFPADMGEALGFQSKVETAFRKRFPDPLHIPRPQLLFVNRLKDLVDFVPSPKAGIKVLFGDDYPEPDYSDAERIRTIDRKNLLGMEEYLENLPYRLLDVIDHYLWGRLRELSWRISPTVPRALHVLGRTTMEAWSANRTQLANMLQENSEQTLSDDYIRYYCSVWDFYLTENPESARAAFTSAAGILQRGIEIGKSSSL